jgi:putative SOS response-associated peptidase YedK
LPRQRVDLRAGGAVRKCCARNRDVAAQHAGKTVAHFVRRRADRETMGFETLTLAPIDRRLIVKDMLTADEVAWLDAYHARVAAALSPELDDEARAWLKAATAPL